MLYRYDGKTFEFAGVVVESDDPNVVVDKANTTEVNPFDETGLTVTGNYFNPEKQVWYNKPQPVDTTQQTLSTFAKQVVDLSVSKSTLTKADSALAQQVVQLTDQNKKLQQAVATLAAQVVQTKGGN